MAGSRHRAPAHRLGRWLVPCGGALFLWLADNDPGGPAGASLLLGTGLLVSLFYPLLILIALESPGALIPPRWRAWHHHRSVDAYGKMTRPHISTRVRRLVYAADRRRCCYCGSMLDIQLDHFRPWASGGRTSFWNMFTLCGFHNRVKSNYWRDRDGYVHYRSFPGHHVPAMAADILACERRRRWSPARIIRAAVAL